MADFAKRSQVEIPKRLVADDVRAEVERIASLQRQHCAAHQRLTRLA